MRLRDVRRPAHTYGDVAAREGRQYGFFWVISAHEFQRDMIREGDPAPDFDLETDEGSRISLSSLEGRNVVLFFYPKDNTSG